MTTILVICAKKGNGPTRASTPTFCTTTNFNPSKRSSQLADVFSPADDVPVSLSDRFQAASCASLGFKPGLHLRGGTHRGDHPGLTATYRPRPGDANASGVVVRLPRSAFLEQAHIRTVCTRMQFAAEACPPGAQYGYIKAWAPLLDEPLQGPVYLRSSDQIPDAPLSKVLLTMQGGKKGLIVNSRNLCESTNHASAQFDAHNGKIRDFRPELRPECGRKHKRPRK